ncbi:hypothetical protein FRC20_008793 [Serendipita sp. 405]|nr:hypothetical protein FRC16_008724 [Serendipita sp. 398]KAG8866341.1 hypothetical protein FRC20_008793 [Serendipita sp. 405]
MHCNGLRRIGQEHIQNHLPIHLVESSEGKLSLVNRAKIQREFEDWVDQHYHDCQLDMYSQADEEKCFRSQKEKMRYIILSHRWGKDELSFKDLSEAGSISEAEDTSNHKGKDKLIKLCQVANYLGCKYAWMDTVCIDKQSSAELEESIRSMFQWYRDSYACVVHLNETNRKVGEMENDPWFKRGWTLQELLASKSVLFFTRDWKRITRRDNDKIDDAEAKDDCPLMSTIQKITNIPIDDLLDFKPGLYNIGQRMKWASKRETTRVEDMAYSLMGIFDVSIPVVYGDREQAFYRLQVEIMQRCGDWSLFAWEGNEPSPYSSMLAVSPRCFSSKAHSHTSHQYLANQTFALTNYGLRAEVKVYGPDENGDWLAILAQLGPDQHLSIVLEQIGDDEVPQFQRRALSNKKIPSESINTLKRRLILIK